MQAARSQAANQATPKGEQAKKLQTPAVSVGSIQKTAPVKQPPPTTTTTSAATPSSANIRLHLKFNGAPGTAAQFRSSSVANPPKKSHRVKAKPVRSPKSPTSFKERLMEQIIPLQFADTYDLSPLHSNAPPIVISHQQDYEEELQNQMMEDDEYVAVLDGDVRFNQQQQHTPTSPTSPTSPLLSPRSPTTGQRRLSTVTETYLASMVNYHRARPAEYHKRMRHRHERIMAGGVLKQNGDQQQQQRRDGERGRPARTRRTASTSQDNEAISEQSQRTSRRRSAASDLMIDEEDLQSPFLALAAISAAVSERHQQQPGPTSGFSSKHTAHSPKRSASIKRNRQRNRNRSSSPASRRPSASSVPWKGVARNDSASFKPHRKSPSVNLNADFEVPDEHLLDTSNFTTSEHRFIAENTLRPIQYASLKYQFRKAWEKHGDFNKTAARRYVRGVDVVRLGRTWELMVQLKVINNGSKVE